ncbi:folate-binding protein [Brevundimonas sp.]|uniref:CAF17-like 4Fe-4S cluster assembly/insertion protein YgfZ n=1 Tax=Brevundimonas sp. TaxID=1871086 RepID=UPI0025CBB6A3|nr:folate-binding protein [Brevundimonas sp.]
MPVARLDSRALIAVTGPDARPFLHNLLTQDLATLKPGELRFGALLGPQGRLLFDLFLLGTDEGVILDCAADRRATLIQRLGMYRLRAAVEIRPDDRPVWAAWAEAAPSDWPVDPRLAGLGRRGFGDGPRADTDEAAYLEHQLGLGVPDPARDAKADADYPIEANFDLLNGIDFQKGCFIGQETTSRMKRRGRVKSRLVPIAFKGAAPAFGTEVLSGELRAGEVRSGAEGQAMALLRLDRLQELTADGRAVAADLPDWLRTVAELPDRP